MINGFFVKTISAEENEYLLINVVDGESQKVASFNSYEAAYGFYNTNLDNYDNLVLSKDNQVIQMEYGTVSFVSNDTCSLNIGYRSLLRNKTTSFNACYSNEAAYLYSSTDGQTVYFKLAGDIGSTTLEDVTLWPFGLNENKISAYENIDGVLIHKIVSATNNDYYRYAVALDDAEEYLQANKDYYSYDGHYFYDDFKKMIDDYKAETYDNSINYDNPYYNYYQYLPFRSLTNYDYSEIEAYFYDELMISDKIYAYEDANGDGANDVVNASQYYDELKAFIEYQNTYGVNALLSLGISINESAYGKSKEAFVNNNVFAKTAYENKDNGRYASIADSIRAYCKYYLSRKYANVKSDLYNGLFLGNKASGMNVEYSLDPYWGEKAASNYYLSDRALGYKDKDSYALGIIINNNAIELYADKDLKESKLVVKNVSEYSLVLLEDLGEVYKVQIDPSFNEDYEYDFENNIAYIDKELITIVLNENNIHNNELVTIAFDAGEGQLDEKNIRQYQVLKGTTPVVNDPVYEGYQFIGFDCKVVKATETKTYTAKYQKIESLEIVKAIKTPLQQNTYLDLSGSTIKVKYEAGGHENIQINTNMLSNMLVNEQNTYTLQISYGGLTIEEDLEVASSSTDLKTEVEELIIKNLLSYKSKGTYNLEEINWLKNNLTKVKLDYSMEEIRELDQMLLAVYQNKANYRIEDEQQRSFSVSGLTLFLADNNITKWFKPFKDTYYVHLGKVSESDQKTLAKIGAAYGFEVVDYFKISYALNLKEIESNGPIVFSLAIDNKQDGYIYTIYRLDSDGKIIKCKTTQSTNCLSFISDQGGSFAVLAKKGVNQYRLVDEVENITEANSSPDNHRLFIRGGLLIFALVLGTACIVIYYKIENKRKRLWNDFKKSLPKAAFVQEEKPKN